jgi:hypothetical protein
LTWGCGWIGWGEGISASGLIAPMMRLMSDQVDIVSGTEGEALKKDD